MNIHPHNFVAMGLVWRELGLTCVFSPLLKTLPQPLQSPCLVCQEWREFFFFFLCFLTFDFPALLLSLFLSFSLSLVLFQFCSRKNSQNKPMAAYPNTHTHALSVSQNSITKVCFVWLFSRHTHTRTHLCGDSYLFVVVCWMLASLPPIFCSCPLPPPSLSLSISFSRQPHASRKPANTQSLFLQLYIPATCPCIRVGCTVPCKPIRLHLHFPPAPSFGHSARLFFPLSVTPYAQRLASFTFRDCHHALPPDTHSQQQRLASAALLAADTATSPAPGPVALHAKAQQSSAPADKAHLTAPMGGIASNTALAALRCRPQSPKPSQGHSVPW